MTTKPRITAPDHYYQISSVGNTNYNILRNDLLKLFFLDQLSHYLKKYAFTCVSWSLMDNHYHLIIKTGSNPTISLFMQTLNSVFAKKYNKINNTFGSVFAKRFSSIVVQKGDLLKELIRHIHLNPVRSGECTLENLDSYQWCGHNEIVNDRTNSIIDRTDVLNLFNGSDKITEYKTYVTIPCKEVLKSVKLMRSSNKGSLNFHKSNCLVIGDNDFTRSVFEQDLTRKARIALYLREGISKDDILRKINIGIQFTSESIRMHGRLNEQSTFRQIYALLAHCYYEFPCTKIAQYLHVSPSAVSMMISRCNRITDLSIIREFIGF